MIDKFELYDAAYYPKIGLPVTILEDELDAPDRNYLLVGVFDEFFEKEMGSGVYEVKPSDLEPYEVWEKMQS